MSVPPPTDEFEPSRNRRGERAFEEGGQHGPRLGHIQESVAPQEITEMRLETQAESSSKKALNVMLRIVVLILLALKVN